LKVKRQRIVSIYARHRAETSSAPDTDQDDSGILHGK